MNIIPENKHIGWNDFLEDPKIESEIEFIHRYLSGEEFFPDKKNVLRFLTMDPCMIKCVIVGMEPYPTDFESEGYKIPIATGRSFEVANVTSWSQKFKQSSLRNILKTIYYETTGEEKGLAGIREEIENGQFNISQPGNWFDNMELQGVLFLNASLTVKKYEVNTHSSLWKIFMDELIKFVDVNSHPYWLLFGKHAQNRVLPLIDKQRATCVYHPRISEFVRQKPFHSISNKINIVV